MKKHMRLLFFALLLTAVSGCFPVLVPPPGGGHYDGRGGDGNRHGDRDRGDRH